jgi:hypothetical protein
MSGSVHVCAACPRALGRSCCEPGDAHGLATLTGGDIARIRGATGKAARHFVDEEVFDPLQAHAHAQLRPANRHAVVGGARRHLRARDGACVFHRADAGCALSSEVRPLACRLYPVEVDAFGLLRLAPADRCHAEESLDGLPELLAAMDLTPARALALHDQLVEELEADASAAGE